MHTTEPVPERPDERGASSVHSGAEDSRGYSLSLTCHVTNPHSVPAIPQSNAWPTGVCSVGFILYGKPNFSGRIYMSRNIQTPQPNVPRTNTKRAWPIFRVAAHDAATASEPSGFRQSVSLLSQ